MKSIFHVILDRSMIGCSDGYYVYSMQWHTHSAVQLIFLLLPLRCSPAALTVLVQLKTSLAALLSNKLFMVTFAIIFIFNKSKPYEMA